MSLLIKERSLYSILSLRMLTLDAASICPQISRGEFWTAVPVSNSTFFAELVATRQAWFIFTFLSGLRSVWDSSMITRSHCDSKKGAPQWRTQLPCFLILPQLSRYSSLSSTHDQPLLKR